jgi:hypothetical protein
MGSLRSLVYNPMTRRNQKKSSWNKIVATILEKRLASTFPYLCIVLCHCNEGEHFIVVSWRRRTEYEPKLGETIELFLESCIKSFESPRLELSCCDALRATGYFRAFLIKEKTWDR